MDKIFFFKISSNNSGLCNQLFSLISAICTCIRDNKNIIVISNFIKSINSNNYCSISEIINIEKINIFLIRY